MFNAPLNFKAGILVADDDIVMTALTLDYLSVVSAFYLLNQSAKEHFQETRVQRQIVVNQRKGETRGP